MRRKLVTLAVVALFAGCGFPSVGFEPAGDGSEGGTVEASADGAPHAEGSSGDDEGGSDGPQSGGDTGGTSSGGDGSSGSDSSGGSDSTASDAPHDAVPDIVVDVGKDAPDCDQDHDTYIAAACGGTDCCDTDANAHPNQTSFFTTEDACNSFDYNCDTKIEMEYTTANLTCGGTGLTGCTGGSGYTGPSVPACGQSGAYGTCEGSGTLKCTAQGIFDQTQACQ